MCVPAILHRQLSAATLRAGAVQRTVVGDKMVDLYRETTNRENGRRYVVCTSDTHTAYVSVRYTLKDARRHYRAEVQNLRRM